MANELKVGERQVYTTPSSLASRMGVVKGQTGDGFIIAADSLGKTIGEFAKRQATIEEENWKNDYKLESYKTISKFAIDHSMDSSEFMNKASSYIESSIAESPEKYKAWSKSYSGLMASQYNNEITNRTIKKRIINSIKLFSESEKSELDDINRLILNTKPNITDISDTLDRELTTLYKEHTTLFGENIMPRISEIALSYEKLYNSLPPEYIKSEGWVTPKEYLRGLKVGLEQSRVISVAKNILDKAIELQDQGIIGSDIKGWEVSNPVDLAEKDIAEYLQNYLNNPDVGESDGPFTFIDSTLDERKKIATDVEGWVKKYSTDYKEAKDTETKLEEANRNLSFQSWTSYDAGSLNDSRTTVTEEDYNQIIFSNTWSDDQLVGLKNAYDEGIIIRRSIERNMGFDSTLGSIRHQLGELASDNEKMGSVENNLLNYYAGQYMKKLNRNSNGIINPDNFSHNTVVTDGVVVDVISDDLQAVINLASETHLIHPSLENFMNGAKQINTESNDDINKLYQIAKIQNVLEKKTGISISFFENAKMQGALKQFWYDVQHMTEDDVLKMKNFADKFLAKINNQGTDYGKKVEAIEEILNGKNIDLEEILKKEYRAEKIYRYISAFSAFGQQRQRIEFMPNEYKDAIWMFDHGGTEMFNEFVMDYLVSQYASVGDIKPSAFDEVSKWNPKGWFENGNEGGMNVVNAIHYALTKMSKQGYR